VPVLITMWVQGPPTFPVARTHEHREVRHGGTVVDPYFWLREKNNPEVVRYLESENAYTQAMTSQLKPFETSCIRRCLAALSRPILMFQYGAAAISTMRV